nr:helix-turn-helix domain-containing protein [Streptomyces sulphureus]
MTSIGEERAGSTVAWEPSMSKTLHHGLLVLELLSENPKGLSTTEIAEGIGLHRTVAHRLVRTLEAHHLCRRDEFKRILPATGLVSLAEPVERDLRALARPVLEHLADATRATTHLVVREDESEVRALLVVEPREAKVHVSFRPGQTHPVDAGSAGLALLASAPPLDGERPEVAEARRQGYAVTHGEVIPAVIGVSAAVPSRRGRSTTSVGVSVFELPDAAHLGRTVTEAAAELADRLR